MKKKSSKQQKAAKSVMDAEKSRRTKSRPKKLRPKSTQRSLSQAAETIGTGAKKLFVKAHLLDEKADALHQSAHELHQKATQLHHPDVLARVPEQGAIVMEDYPSGQEEPFTIVGIGASAGGYEAFADFLQNLPKNTGMAFVLVQHLDPKHKSSLSELLGHRARIPVVQASNDVEVQPDHIYVIPADSHITLAEGKLQLHPRREHEAPPMAIDVFFRSLAQQQKSRAIGVILSGTGSDGTLGTQAIKGEGGITFAQDDQTSKYYGMPGSAIASGSVDFVLPPAEIAKELARLAQHPMVGLPPRASASISPEAAELERLLRESPNELNTLFRLLRARTSVDFSFYKQSTLKRRIMRRMILQKCDILGKYIKLVESSPPELDALFNDLLINVTSFFRDPLTFKVLKKKVFPRLIKAHNGDSALRFWVCGCSTGEEAYSLAMSLVEFFDENRCHRPVQIFGTDVSESWIEKARAGIYPANIQQDVSAERLRRFFTKIDGSYQIHKSIREMCVFARQNLQVDPPFSGLDLISCRNVLIYFGPVLQGRVVPLFHYALRNTGFLLLGNAETIGANTEYFSLLDKKHKIYSKKASFLKPAFEARAHKLETKDVRSGTPAPPRENKPIDLQQHVDRLLLRDFSPATVVVDSQMDVVHFRGRTGAYLEHAPGTASLNIFKMLREGLSVSVRAALSKAARQDTPVKQAGIEFRHNGHTFELNFEVIPFRLEPGTERFFAIIFRESASPLPVPSAGSKSGSSEASNRLRHELARVKTELMGTKESMQSIIEEQEATNEELKSANEEIQSSNEELQSTNEELETAKEELQSTNEELTTLNEELQNRNAELSQVHNDLLNLLASVNLPIVLVGNDLTVRRFTPMAERIFNLIPSDVGRRLTDINRSVLLPQFDQLIHQVIDELIVVERETQDRDGHWYVLRIRPYRTRENKIDGAVIILIGVEELRQVLEVVLGMVHQPLLVLGFDFKIRSANDSFLKTFNLAEDETVGRLIYELDEGQWDAAQLHNLLEETLPRNNKVTDFVLEMHLPKLGFRKLRVNASRFSEEGKGMPLILLGFEEG